MKALNEFCKLQVRKLLQAIVNDDPALKGTAEHMMFVAEGAPGDEKDMDGYLKAEMKDNHA